MAKKTPTKSKPQVECIDWGSITYESYWAPHKGLGPNDRLYGVDKIWPVYCLDLTDPLSLYHRFQEQLRRLQKKSDNTTTKDMAEYINDNPHIYMELLIFEEILKESLYFKISNKIYCYCVDTLTPLMVGNSQKIILRFLFDPFKVLNLPYNIES